MTTTYYNPQNLKHRSDAVIHNGLAYLSGVIPTDHSADFDTQVQQVLAQLDERLAAVGSSKERILSATIWLANLNRDIAAFNAIWNPWLVPGREPSRSCIQG